MAAYCRTCQCEARQHEVDIVGRHRNQLAGGLLGALTIKEKREECFGALSVALPHKKEAFMASEQRKRNKKNAKPPHPEKQKLRTV